MYVVKYKISLYIDYRYLSAQFTVVPAVLYRLTILSTKSNATQDYVYTIYYIAMLLRYLAHCCGELVGLMAYARYVGPWYSRPTECTTPRLDFISIKVLTIHLCICSAIERLSFRMH